MRADDVAKLNSATNETLAQWWCELNNWGWPMIFADPEPAEYKPDDRRGQIMHWIVAKISRKECLRYWNRETMPGEEFDRWYDNGMRHATNK